MSQPLSDNGAILAALFPEWMSCYNGDLSSKSRISIVFLPQLFIALASLSGFCAVALGALGAHGLKNRLAPEMMDIWHTAVQYQFWHTLALFGVGILLTQGIQSKYLTWSGCLFAAGILIFSGSLYILCLSGIRWLGAITPIGGTLWLAAWLCLAYASFKS